MGQSNPNLPLVSLVKLLALEIHCFGFFFFPDCATGSREATRWGRGGSLVYNIDRFFSKLLGSEWTLEITELR